MKYYASMKVHSFSKCGTTEDGRPLNVKNGPDKFIPVFDTREEAEAWGGAEHVAVFETVEKQEAAP